MSLCMEATTGKRGLRVQYNVYFDYSALALLGTILILFSHMHNTRNQKMNMVGMTICTIIVATILDLVTVAIDTNQIPIPVTINYILNSLYLLLSGSVSVFYYNYIYILSRGNAPLTSSEVLKNAVGYFGILGLLVVNCFTPCVFYFNEAGFYTHAEMFWLLYGIASLYLIATIVLIVRYPERFNGFQKFTVVFYSCAILFCIILQVMNPKVLITQFVEALSCSLILYSLDNPADYRNKSLGMLNQLAFVDCFNGMIASGKKFIILGIRIEGISNINELLGRSFGDQTLADVARILKEIGGKRYSFYLDGSDFCLVGEYSNTELEQLEERIRYAFKDPLMVCQSQIRLSVPMCKIVCPENAKTIDETLALIHGALDTAEKNNGDIVEVDSDIVAYGKRESYIVQALKTAIAEHTFEVYYQPIYNVEEQCYTRAEALVRLNDPVLGPISPAEFIPIAEEKGLIIEIGSIIFRDVCKMLSREQVWEYGIERVDVNLSAIQCMYENMADSLLDIMDSYRIPYKSINFEITETAAVISKEVLKRNMEKLLDKGVNFSMDDFGTGYSNTITISEYPFSVVKLDKSMLWSAMENPNALTALKHTIAMIDEMGFEIITEGVETLEMAEKLQELGCYLHQGFYYTKPLSESKFLETVKNSVV